MRLHTGAKVAATLAVLTVLLGASGCGQSGTQAPQAAPAKQAAPATPAAPAPQGPIRVGYLAALSGGAASFGEPAKEGVQLALEEINAAGGIGGQKVELVIGDDKGDPTVSVQELQRLTQKEKVAAIVSASISTAEMARMDALVKEKIVEIVTVSADPRVVVAGKPYALRNEINSDVFAGTVATYAVKNLGFKRLAMMVLNDAYGKSLATPFAARVKELGAELVAQESYEAASKDYKDLLVKIKAANPDALMMAGLAGDTALIAKQAREVGLKAVLMGANVQSTPQFRDVAGPAAEGTVFSVAYMPGATGSATEKQFIENYRKKYNKEPNTYAAHAYDAMHMLARALQKAGGKPEQVRAALMELKDFPGVTGTMSLNDTGEVAKPAYVATIAGGQVKYVATIGK